MNGVILIGLLLIATQCSPTATPIAQETPPPGDRPPEITGFTLSPPGPVFPGARIGIWANVDRKGHEIDIYRWFVRAGEGSIVSGQGAALITYEAPRTPGTYEVRVELEYEGGPPVEGSTKVEVVPEPTPTSKYIPTSTPTPTNTTTPTFTHTPVMPTPTPYAVVTSDGLNLRAGPGMEYPIIGVLTKGDRLAVTGINSAGSWLSVTTATGKTGWVARFVEFRGSIEILPTIQAPPTPTGTPTPILLPAPVVVISEPRLEKEVHFKWEWIRELEAGEFYSVRLWNIDDTPETPCFHFQIPDSEYVGPLPTACRQGRLAWSVRVVKRKDEEGWIAISEESEVSSFDWVP